MCLVHLLASACRHSFNAPHTCRKLKANLNLIASQLGKEGTVWDVEWNNGTSFIFSRDEPVCKTMHFEVGILTPDWLAGSTHLGQMETDTFVCHVWTKAGECCCGATGPIAVHGAGRGTCPTESAYLRWL